MFGSPYYPAGVTDADIEYYFGGAPFCCKTCRYYSCGICEKRDSAYTKEELAEMDEDEIKAYERDITVGEDDYCEKYKCEEIDEEEGW